jgi:hypothetical protein
MRVAQERQQRSNHARVVQRLAARRRLHERGHDRQQRVNKRHAVLQGACRRRSSSSN